MIQERGDLSQKKIPAFTCSCGIEILIVPNLEEMNKTIEEHLNVHLQLTGTEITKDELSDQILSTLCQYFR